MLHLVIDSIYSTLAVLLIFVLLLPSNNDAFTPTHIYSGHSIGAQTHLTGRGSSTAMASTTNNPNPTYQMDGCDIGTPLPQYLTQKEIDPELSQIICAVASACTDIARELTRLPITNAITAATSSSTSSTAPNINVQGEVQKGMDVSANQWFIDRVGPTVAAMASEEEEDVILGSPSMKYAIAFDPLDGSSNLDVSVPTGSIFSIAPHTPDNPFSTSGRSILAAGYTVYSSSVELVISLGQSGSMGTAGFTLDPNLTPTPTNTTTPSHPASCFILSRPSLHCPPHGPYYSLNDAREPDWPNGLRRWIHDAKRGLTPSGTKYSSRYVCSLCADVHRTILKGGWAGNPRPHLRLLYEAAPLAHVLEGCGGRGSDGVRCLLDVTAESGVEGGGSGRGGLHYRVPVFLGSVEDVRELEGYGDVQQGYASYDA